MRSRLRRCFARRRRGRKCSRPLNINTVHLYLFDNYIGAASACWWHYVVCEFLRWRNMDWRYVAARLGVCVPGVLVCPANQSSRHGCRDGWISAMLEVERCDCFSGRQRMRQKLGLEWFGHTTQVTCVVATGCCKNHFSHHDCAMKQK